MAFLFQLVVWLIPIGFVLQFYFFNPLISIDKDESYTILSLYKAKVSRVFLPDTFTDKFSKAIEEINIEKKFEDDLGNKIVFDFTIHDLRRTFITNAFRMGINPVDIQLAVGHKYLRTTLAYQTDDRSMDDRTYVPEESHLKAM